MIVKPSLHECGIQESGEMLAAFRDHVIHKAWGSRNPLKIFWSVIVRRAIYSFLCERATPAQAKSFADGALFDHE